MPSQGDNLSLAKLGRATAVGNSDYTSQTSLNSAGRDSGTGETKLSEFYISAVDNSVTGNTYVDEQTNEIYTLTFASAGGKFASRIGARHQNFTWTTSNSDLFAIQSNQDVSAQYNGGAIADANSFVSKSFEANLVDNHDFSTWTDSTTPGSWAVSSGNVERVTTTSEPGGTVPTASSDFNLKFRSNGAEITQNLTVKGNSTYELVAIGYSSDTTVSNIFVTMSIQGGHTTAGAYDWAGGILGDNNQWSKFRHDFHTSGSDSSNRTLQIRLKAPDGLSTSPYIGLVYLRRWEGANFTDTDVTISGKYHDAEQSDGFNDQATRYNTAIQKTVEIQDTYGGLSIACFTTDTLIRMADGSEKAIEDVSVGEEVMSVKIPNLPDEDLGYNVWKTWESTDDMSNLEVTGATIENMFFDYKEGYYNINNQLLKVTDEHPIWAYRNGKWTWCTAKELLVGDEVLNYKGENIKVDSISFIGGEVEVVNIDVEPLDVYFAGGVLVHNKGTDSDPG